MDNGILELQRKSNKGLVHPGKRKIIM